MVANESGEGVEYNKQRLHKVSYIFVLFGGFVTPNDDAFHTIAVLVCGFSPNSAKTFFSRST
jgi:hypothetical protein